MSAALLQPPRIGQPWPEQGGIYAGLVRGADGGPDQHVILSATLPSKRLKWKPACTWATELADAGFSDWALPTRDEGALLYANLRHLVEPGWYWLVEHCSAGHAWSQSFDNGGQTSYYESYEGRCRAVRRFSLQSFNSSTSVEAAERGAE